MSTWSFVVKGLNPKPFGGDVAGRIVVDINVGPNLFDKMLRFTLLRVETDGVSFNLGQATKGLLPIVIYLDLVEVL